tara:strand:- start:98037 stop:99032 length:996 start_codon:yes stop_codon:yes gene_type:complete
MIHQRSASTFRVVEWPTSQASHFRIFNTPKLRYDLSVLVDFLAQALYETNKAFVRYSTFSLVNVVSPIAGLSFGYDKPPYEDIRHFHPLSFTFAFTRRDEYNGEIRPRFQMRPAQYVTFWGHTQIGNADFVTINVPKRVMRDVRLLTPNMREMEWLYMAIGAWSKNFAQRFDFYTRKGWYNSDPISVETARAKFYYQKMQHLFKHVPYDQWGYAKDMWELAPNFLNPKAANTDFIDYYCRYLAHDYYRKYSVPNVQKIEKLAEKYVASGVLDALPMVVPDAEQGDAPGETFSRNLTTVLDMLGGNLNLLADRSDVQNIARDLLSGNLRGAQ